MDEISLSICIPTYNRVEFLKRLLTSIVAQGNGLAYEVWIQDNDSTDGTKELAEEFCKDFENWHYEKNEKNLGALINIRKCTEKANGNNIIIIGDDDTMLPDAFSLIEQVINKLKGKKYGAVLFNTRLSDKFEICSKFKNGFEWLRYVGINVPAFISAVMWEKDFWLKFDYNEILENFWIPQLHCFVNASNEDMVYGINKEIVTKGMEIQTNVKSYSFYRFHSLVDCFEYPYLYDVIKKNQFIDYKTKLFIFLRGTKFIKEMIKKVAFIKNNENDYIEYIPQLTSAYKNKLYRPFMYMYVKLIFNTKVGGRLAKKIYSEN